MKIWFRIEAGHYVAGGELETDPQKGEMVVSRDRLAPIIKWMAGKTEKWLKNYCWFKGYKIQTGVDCESQPVVRPKELL